MTAGPGAPAPGRPRPSPTRRRVLGALAGVGALGAGLGLAAWRPAPELVLWSCQEGTRMQGKVLVAYATRTGSTGEVAEAIARQLCAAGLAAEVRPVADVSGLAGYAAAVLGSAIRYAAWLSEMLELMTAERGTLQQMPVAFFTMHMLALGDDPGAAEERGRYTSAARAVVTPIDEAFFAGKIDPGRLSFLDRIAVRLVKSPVGDRRDWPRITAWADGLAPRLVPKVGG